jgi:hypothetical protein
LVVVVALAHPITRQAEQAVAVEEQVVRVTPHHLAPVAMVVIPQFKALRKETQSEGEVHKEVTAHLIQI